jgi:hypothetical protein
MPPIRLFTAVHALFHFVPLTYACMHAVITHIDIVPFCPCKASALDLHLIEHTFVVALSYVSRVCLQVGGGCTITHNVNDLHSALGTDDTNFSSGLVTCAVGVTSSTNPSIEVNVQALAYCCPTSSPGGRRLRFL